MYVKLISYTPQPERVVAQASKLCYSSSSIRDIGEKMLDDDIQKMILMLLDRGHMSPFEHINFTFGVEGISRITETQLVRHRIASYSVQSGRYLKRNDASFTVPDSISKVPMANKLYMDLVDKSIKTYNQLFTISMLKQIGLTDDSIEELFNEQDGFTKKMIEAFGEGGYKRGQYGNMSRKAIEDARYAHLQSIETKLIFTMNARELLHVISLRTCTRAQWEIRNMFNLVLEEVKKVAPTIFKNAGPSCVQLGYCPEGEMSCKRKER